MGKKEDDLLAAALKDAEKSKKKHDDKMRQVADEAEKSRKKHAALIVAAAMNAGVDPKTLDTTLTLLKPVMAAPPPPPPPPPPPRPPATSGARPAFLAGITQGVQLRPTTQEVVSPSKPVVAGGPNLAAAAMLARGTLRPTTQTKTKLGPDPDDMSELAKKLAARQAKSGGGT